MSEPYRADELIEVFRAAADDRDYTPLAAILADSAGWPTVMPAVGLGTLLPSAQRAAFVMRLPHSVRGPERPTARFRITVERLED